MHIIEGSNPSIRTTLPIIGGKNDRVLVHPAATVAATFSVRQRILGNRPCVFKRRAQ